MSEKIVQLNEEVIREHAGDQAVIIVVGYPGLLNVKGDKTFFNETEAQYIDFQV